jgi:copper chaperone
VIAGDRAAGAPAHRQRGRRPRHCGLGADALDGASSSDSRRGTAAGDAMQIEVINVIAMHSPGCGSRVSRVLRAIHGVDAARVSLERAEAVVEFDEALCSPEQLRWAVQAAGYGIEGARRLSPRGRAAADA